MFVEQTRLYRFTVLRRINDLSYNIKETLKERLKLCGAFSLTLDESTDISNTARFVIFIRAVTAGFDIVEEFLDMARFPPQPQEKISVNKCLR